MPRRSLPGGRNSLLPESDRLDAHAGHIVLREIVTVTTVGNRKRKIELGMGPCRKLCFQDRLEPVIKAV